MQITIIGTGNMARGRSRRGRRRGLRSHGGQPGLGGTYASALKVVS